MNTLAFRKFMHGSSLAGPSSRPFDQLSYNHFTTALHDHDAQSSASDYIPHHGVQLELDLHNVGVPFNEDRSASLHTANLPSLQMTNETRMFEGKLPTNLLFARDETDAGEWKVKYTEQHEGTKGKGKGKAKLDEIVVEFDRDNIHGDSLLRHISSLLEEQRAYRSLAGDILHQ